MTDDAAANAGHDEAYLLSRREHYGTQTADTISNLKDTVEDYDLSEFVGWSNAVHTSGDQSIGGTKRFTGTVTVPTPAASSYEAANTDYVDSAIDTTVHLTGSQDVHGHKKFWDMVEVQDPDSETSYEAANTRFVTGFAVKLTGNQSVAGNKSFTGATSMDSLIAGTIHPDSFQRGSGSWAGTNYAEMFNVTGFAISDVTWSDVGFDRFVNERSDDVDSIFDGIAFKTPVNGIWTFSACITTPVASTDYYFAMQFLTNTNVNIAQQSFPAWNGDKATLTATRYLTTGHSVKLRVYHNYSPSLTFPANGNNSPSWFSACLIA